MDSLRLRVAIALGLFGMVPMLLLLVVVTFLNVGNLPIIVSLILLVGCLMAGWLVAASLVRPFVELIRDLEEAVEGRVLGSGRKSRFSELAKIRRALSILLTNQKNAKLRIEELVAQRTRKLAESQTLLERSNDFLAATYDSSPDGLLIVDLKGRLITANRDFFERFDVPREVIDASSGGLANRICRQFKGSELIRQRWDHYLLNPNISAQEVWQGLEPGHGIYSIFTAPITLEDSSPLARLWVFRDSTQEQAQEHGLQQAQKMEAVGRLAGGVAHDFNNLLAVISGNLSLAHLEAGEKHPVICEYLGAAQQATERAIELVRQLLGYSRKSHLVLSCCNLNDVVGEVGEILRNDPHSGIEVWLDLVPDLWGVKADSAQIQQVLLSMCENARDAILEPAGEITLSTRNSILNDKDAESTGHLLKAGEFAVISVRDNGEGISPELRDRIFEPFFSTKDTGSGTGLGLAMSFGIIRQHDGWIDVISESGEGTEFVIYLPRFMLPKEEIPEEFAASPESAACPGSARHDGQTEGNAAEQSEATLETDPAQPSMGSGMGRSAEGHLVLLVDDDDSVRAIGERVLSEKGFRVITASDGLQGLERIAQYGNRISAIMLDLTMPNLSGGETFKRLNEVGSTIPVLICSGFLVDLDEFARETGGRPAGFLQKPYKFEGLVTSLRKVIESGKGKALEQSPAAHGAASAFGGKH